MTTAKMSPLRRRMVEDMQIRGLEATTQASYLRAIEAFAGFLGRSPDSATPAELRAWQLQMARVPKSASRSTTTGSRCCDFSSR